MAAPTYRVMPVCSVKNKFNLAHRELIGGCGLPCTAKHNPPAPTLPVLQALLRAAGSIPLPTWVLDTGLPGLDHSNNLWLLLLEVQQRVQHSETYCQFATVTREHPVD